MLAEEINAARKIHNSPFNKIFTIKIIIFMPPNIEDTKRQTNMAYKFLSDIQGLLDFMRQIMMAK